MRQVQVVLFLLVIYTQALPAQTKQFGITPAQGNTFSAQSASSSSTATSSGIEYHGGPIMPGPHNVYLIWYGLWGGNSATSILPDFISSLGGSPYFNTNINYTDNGGNFVSNTVTLAGQSFDNELEGNVINDDSIIQIVDHAISNNLPSDPNGIYFVLTSPDVDENEPDLVFCSQICGYHSRTTLDGTDIKYSFVGNPDKCLATNNSCLEMSPSPNGNSAADAMASVMAHELNETVTDPDLNAWFHNNVGGEVGDLCVPFVVGYFNSFKTASGANANITLGDRDYLIQANYVNALGSTGGCQMAFTTPPPGTPLPPGTPTPSNTPPPPSGGPDFSLAVNNTSETIASGNPAPFFLGVTPTHGNNGSYTFNVSGLPSGAGKSFSPATLTSNSGFSLAQLFTVAPGTYPLTFTATNSSNVSHSVSVSLVSQPSSLLSIGFSPQGDVLSNPATMACGNRFGGPCSQYFAHGSSVTLRAAATGFPWVFSHWTGDCTGTDPCTLLMNQSHSVGEEFRTDLGLSHVDIGNGNSETFYVGAAPDQHVHMLLNYNGAWGNHDVNSYAGAPTNVIPETGSPVISANVGGQNTETFFIGTDDHVHMLLNYNGAWGNHDINSYAGAPTNVMPQTSSPLAHIDIGNGNSETFYIGTDNHVHMLLNYNGAWGNHDVNSYAGAPTNVLPAPGSSLVSASIGNGNSETFYIGMDGHVHMLLNYNGAWGNHDLNSYAGAPTNVPPAGGSPLSHVDIGNGNSETFYIGTDNHVHMLLNYNGAWGNHDVSSYAGAPTNVLPGNALLDFVGTSLITTNIGGENTETFYVGTDQHVHMLLNYNGAWGNHDLNSYAQSPTNVLPAVGTPLSHFDLGNGNSETFYVGTDQHVHMLLNYNGAWGNHDLNSYAGAPTNVIPE
jgi:hypothetical protein